MRKAAVLFALVLTSVAHAAGPEVKYKTPRTENGHPDLQGMWDFNSDVPLERPASAKDRKTWTREELEARKTALGKTLVNVRKFAPVEDVALTVLEYNGAVEDLRTSLISHPENGKLPKLVDGARRVFGAADVIAALAEGGQLPPDLLAGFLNPAPKQSHEDSRPPIGVWLAASASRSCPDSAASSTSSSRRTRSRS